MKKGLVYIVLASAMWGTSGLFVNFTAGYGVSSLQMTLVRMAVSFVCMAVYALISDRRLFKTDIKELILFALGGISVFATSTLYFYAMQLTSVATAVVLMYTAPIFVMIYSVLFLGEKLTALKTVSVIGMIIGCVLVSGVIGGLKINVLGIGLGFLSGISYAIYNIITKIQMQKGINPVKSNIYSFLFGTVAGLIIAQPISLVHHMASSPSVIPLMIAMGIVTCVLPYFTYTLALREIPAGVASSLGILEPMAATVFSMIFLKQIPHPTAFIGIVLILGSVVLLSRQSE